MLSFLYGHLFLSLFFYISNECDIQDLSINIDNLNLWKSHNSRKTSLLNQCGYLVKNPVCGI